MRPIRIKEAERILLLMSDPGQTSCSAAAEFGQGLDHGVGNPGMSDDDRFGRFFFGISHAAIGTARYLWRTSGEYASTPLPGSVQLSLGAPPGNDPRMQKIPARGCLSG